MTARLARNFISYFLEGIRQLNTADIARGFHIDLKGRIIIAFIGDFRQIRFIRLTVHNFI